MSGTTSRRLAGIASMTINGDAWDVVSDLVWRATAVKRETMKGQTAVEGFGEMPMEGMIGAKLRDRADASVGDLNALGDNLTIVVNQANGKTIYGAGMWVTDLGEVNTQEASFSITFEGDLVTEGTI